MYVLNILNAIKKIFIKKLKLFLFKSHYRQITFTKENSYFPMKHQRKKTNIMKTLQFATKKHLMLVMVKATINHF